MSHFLRSKPAAVPGLPLRVVTPTGQRRLVPARGISLRAPPSGRGAGFAAVPLAVVTPPANHHERVADPAGVLPRVALLVEFRLSLLDGAPAAIERDLPSATTAATTDVR
jgi:hypothetical protein